MKDLCVVIPYTHDSTKEAVKQAYNSVIWQKEHPFVVKVVIWCTSKCPQDLVQYIESVESSIATNFVESTVSFLGDISSSLLTVGSCSEYILLCTCDVIFKENCFLWLAEKVNEYSDNTVLTAYGIRIFPHMEQEKSDKLKESVHWKLYNDAQPDRAVHLFTTEFCFMSAHILNQLSTHSENPYVLSNLDTLWCSYVLGKFLGVPIWKIQTDEFIAFSATQSPHFLPHNNQLKMEQFEMLYHKFFESNWPPSISTPFSSLEKQRAINQCSEKPQKLWQEGFGGVNMSAEPATELDFTAAAAYGIRVIRIGAVCDAKDLAYLIDPQALTFEEDKKHFLQVMPRLKRALSKAGENGLKVIITMTDLPGCKFHTLSNSSPCFPFWESSICRVRAAKFWGLVAESLKDLNAIIMGYDVINEPYTPEDKKVGFFEDMPLGYADTLSQFYADALREIRVYDKEVTVIIKSTWFASPRTFETLQPFSDPKVVYAFHMYAPDTMTLYRAFGNPSSSYPGNVPRKLCSDSSNENVEITQDYLLQLLEKTVHSWQVKHGVPSNQILVAEFGICREVQGAQQYLEDLVSIFQRFKWSWLLFSFRDEEWDALDYELGPSMDNMLERSATKLFLTVANHFH